MHLKTLDQIAELQGKTVLVRTDFNVPLNKEGQIEDDLRIRESLPTIKALQSQGAKIVLISHLGRPEGQIKPEFSLLPIQKHLVQLLHQEVQFCPQIIGPEAQTQIEKLQKGQIILLENIRFLAGEEKCDRELSEQLAKLGDIFINDAFGTAHRAHASTFGLTELLPSYAGFLMEKEIKALKPLLEGKIEKPLTMIFGGAKIDTKIGIIENFLEKADQILLGGGLANTFLYAKGHEVGTSLFEADKKTLALELIDKAYSKIHLPSDFITAKEISEDAKTEIHPASAIPLDQKILDIGPESIKSFSEIIKNSATIIWNGPLGLYELTPFRQGTAAIAKALNTSSANTIIGGGDTADAVHKLGYTRADFSHISTGGGACIEYLSGIKMPAIEALMQGATKLTQ